MNLTGTDPHLRTFKSIRSLLPSVQNKIAHNAIVKLLLDQGKSLSAANQKTFSPILQEWERLCRIKQIPVETIYRTSDTTIPLPGSLAFQFPLPPSHVNQNDTPCLTTILIPDAFARFLVSSLLGGTSTASPTYPLSALEKSILEKFLRSWILPLTYHCEEQRDAAISATKSTSFIFKTKESSYLFHLTLPAASHEPAEPSFAEKLTAHLSASAMSVSGFIEQTIPLSHLMTLKKGDTLRFTTPTAETPATLKTCNHTLVIGRLHKKDKNLQLSTEAE